MGIKAEHRPILESLRRKYGIFFFEEVAQEDWPPNHADVFGAVKKLGDIKYDDYEKKYCEVSESTAAAEEPWKYHVKHQAKVLTERAKHCVRRNEATWRSACEQMVLARLSAEVACPNCRKRVWRSTIEVSLNPSDRGAQQLQRRQDKRDLCRCPRDTRPQDCGEVLGLNRIFIGRADESIIHRPELKKALPKKIERPDRVYGLQQTKNLEKLLYDCDGERMVQDLLQTQPVSGDGRPLLFPFLVLEAKSSSAKDSDWHSIKLQTAFPIYTFLEAQQGLRSATGQRSRWQGGPLVWFFMSRGEDWRIYAAYQKHNTGLHGLGGSFETHIVQLWAGCIEQRDAALQLFLIVDYISDWARDSYRPAILTELRILFAADTAEISTTFTDSDIYSMARSLSPQPSDQTLDQRLDGSGATFRSLDSNDGVVRHAAFIVSRFRSLFITSDSIQTLLQSTPENIVQFFTRQILGQLRGKSLLLRAEQLDAIEREWTGCERMSRPFNIAQTKFYTVITITCHITNYWEQVRELSVVAVAEDAFSALVAGSGLKPGRDKASTPTALPVEGDIVTAVASHLKDGSMCHNLLAAISRISLYVESVSSEGHPRLIEEQGVCWELVNYVYKSFKKGRLEPSEPFLRTSARTDTQRFDLSHRGPFPHRRPLEVSPSSAVLVHAHSHSWEAKRNLQSPLCVYLVRECVEVPDQATLAPIIREAFENCDVYQSTRDNGTLNIKLKKDWKAPWNLENPYGVFCSYNSKSFTKWLLSLNASPPTRQGSRRGPLASGSFMHDREYSPWHDPRRINGGLFARLKEKFLKALIPIEFSYWRKVAEERYEQGMLCCASCAKILQVPDGEDRTYINLCEGCDMEMVGPQYPSWFGDEITKGYRNRISGHSGESGSEDENPGEYDISTPERSPFRYRSDGSSSTDNSEDETGDLIPRDPGSFGAIAGTTVAFPEAIVGNLPLSPTTPLRKRKRGADDELR